METETMKSLATALLPCLVAACATGPGDTVRSPDKRDGIASARHAHGHSYDADYAERDAFARHREDCRARRGILVVRHVTASRIKNRAPRRGARYFCSEPNWR